MANLSKVIYINEEDYSTLLDGGTITKGGQTYSYDSTALYVIKNVSAPEYAETAGYATTAGQATKATQDGDGNVIKDTYEKEQQVIIEFNGNDTTFPNLTDPEVRALCNDNSKTVILKDTSLRSQSTEGFPLYYRTEFTTDHWAFSSTYVEAAGAGWLIRLCWDQNQEAIVREFSDTKLYPSENVDLGQAYGVSSDNKNSAARTSSISGFKLKRGGIVAIKFTTDIDITNPSLNISSTGSKPIYYRGSALPRGTVNAGDTVTFIYDGTYYHIISIDKDIPTKTSDLTNDSGFTTNAGTVTGVKMNSGSAISPDANGVVDLGTVITDVSDKQDTLISGTNIKTINSESILGNGDIITGSKIYVGRCNTQAQQSTKVVTTESFPTSGGKPLTGTLIAVFFSNTDTSTSNYTYLNVNSTGAIKIIYGGGSFASGKNIRYTGISNVYTIYMYDGTYWRWITTALESLALSGFGYATQNNSSASSSITAPLSKYQQIAGGIVSIKFTYDVPASATLNINSNSAKAIYNKGAAITAGIIKGGDIATFIYDGTHYQLLSVDSWQDKQDALVSGTNLKTVNSTSLLGSGNVSVQPTLVSGTNIKTINNESLLGSGNITIESSSPTNIEYNSSKTALVIGGGSTKYTINLYDGEALHPDVEINDFTYPASRFPLEVNSGDNLNVVVSERAVTCTTTMGGTTVSTSKSFSIQSVSGNIEIKVTGPSGPGGDGPGIVIDH